MDSKGGSSSRQEVKEVTGDLLVDWKGGQHGGDYGRRVGRAAIEDPLEGGEGEKHQRISR